MCRKWLSCSDYEALLLVPALSKASCTSGAPIRAFAVGPGTDVSEMREDLPVGPGFTSGADRFRSGGGRGTCGGGTQLDTGTRGRHFAPRPLVAVVFFCCLAGAVCAAGQLSFEVRIT